MAQPALVSSIFDQLLSDRIIWLGSEVRDENA
ncbi:MAG TPA: ATP-dependent Clp protease proteolytic subunit, partial [Galbitalea sp.]|nr:ATP-dependent Clp protease proteolytic subunit [Galbitalea sp.]